MLHSNTTRGFHTSHRATLPPPKGSGGSPGPRLAQKQPPGAAHDGNPPPAAPRPPGGFSPPSLRRPGPRPLSGEGGGGRGESPCSATPTRPQVGSPITMTTANQRAPFPSPLRLAVRKPGEGAHPLLSLSANQNAEKKREVGGASRRAAYKKRPAAAARLIRGWHRGWKGGGSRGSPAAPVSSSP